MEASHSLVIARRQKVALRHHRDRHFLAFPHLPLSHFYDDEHPGWLASSYPFPCFEPARSQ